MTTVYRTVAENTANVINAGMYEVFKHYGKWTFKHNSSLHKGWVILDLYKTKKLAQVNADAWRKEFGGGK